MTNKDIAYRYVELLQDGRIDELIALFTENAIVSSPLYGEQLAAHFYPKLSEDTNNSELKVIGVFEDLETDNIALYFNYKWTLADGATVDFDVVDILQFNTEHKITYLKIIYDTVHSRKALNELKDS